MNKLEAYNTIIESITSNEYIDESLIDLVRGEYIDELQPADICEFFGVDEKTAFDILELNMSFGGDTFYKDLHTKNIYQFDGCFFMDSCADEIKAITSEKAYTLLYEADENGEALDPDLLTLATWGGFDCSSFNREWTLLF